MKIFQNLAKETKGFVIFGCFGSDFCASAAVSALYSNIPGEKVLNQTRTAAEMFSSQLPKESPWLTDGFMV